MCASCSDIILILRAPWVWPRLTADELQEELELYMELNATADDHGVAGVID